MFQDAPPVCHAHSVWHRLSKHDAIDATKKIRLRNLKPFLALEVLSPYCVRDLGLRNRFVICCVMLIRISCSRAHCLGHTYLIPPRGAHKSIPLKLVLHSTHNCRRVFWEIVQISNSIVDVESKLGSYCRVSRAYPSHLVSIAGGVSNFNV